jgi:hypothetical protein
MPRRRLLLPLLLSLALHALPAAPALLGLAPSFELDPVRVVEDDAAGTPDAALPPVPEEVVPAELFRVTVLEEARPVAPAAAPLPAPVATVTAPDDPPPEPEVAPEPEPPPPPEPAPEPPPPPPEPVDVATLEAQALAEAARDGSLADAAAPSDDDDGEAYERRFAATRGTRGKGMRGAKAKKNEPCPPPHPSVLATADRPHWTIHRVLVEYYATHIREFDDLGAVWTHKGPDGRLDGVKIGLPRCSLLRQAGLKSGDIVHDVNGLKFFTVLQGFAAYFKLRDETELAVRITRRGQEETLYYTIDEQKHLRRKDRKAAQQAAGDFGKKK